MKYILAEYKAMISFAILFIIFILIIAPFASWIVSLISLGFIVLIQRQVAKGPQCPVSTSLVGKWAVVTGSSAGIGEATAISLVQMGCNVIFACRTESRARASMVKARNTNAKPSLEFISLELGDFDSVRKAAADIKSLLEEKNNGKLDYLVNNAGLMRFGEATRTKSGHEMHLGSNSLGPMLLTELLLSSVSAAKGRVVNVASTAVTFPINWPSSKATDQHPMASLMARLNRMEDPKATVELQAYIASKMLNIVYTRYLAAKLKGTGVRVTSLHPGFCASDITGSSFPALAPFVRYLAPLLFVKTSFDGCQTTLYCMLQGTGLVSGSFYADCRNCDELIDTTTIYNPNDVEATMKWALKECGL